VPTPHAATIELSPQQRHDLRRLARAPSTPQALARRARIVLRAADPDRPTNLQIAQEFGCSKDTVALWRRRFAALGLAGLQDAPRPGRPPAFSPPAKAARH
jgi:FixJ family two-component response regulator